MDKLKQLQENGLLAMAARQARRDSHTIVWNTRKLDRFRGMLQRTWVSLLQMAGGLWWAKRQLRRNEAVVVLTFHRVLCDADFQRMPSLPGIVVRQNTFERLA